MQGKENIYCNKGYRVMYLSLGQWSYVFWSGAVGRALVPHVCVLKCEEHISKICMLKCEGDI